MLPVNCSDTRPSDSGAHYAAKPIQHALVLTTQVAGIGGVQYAGRLLIQATTDFIRSAAPPTVITVRDHQAQLAVIDHRLSRNVLGSGDSRLWAGVRTIWHGLRQRWDFVLLGHLNLAPLLLAVRQRKPLARVAVVYGRDAWHPIRGLKRRGIETVAKILYISEYSRQRSLAANPWLAAIPSTVCHLALLPSNPSEGDGLPALATTRPFALTIGRMSKADRHKGFEQLIRAWPLVNQQQPELELVLIGEGDDRPRLQHLAKELTVPVRFLGAVGDTTRNSYLHACHCFCLPAQGEGFGLVYLEAMRMRKPVLAGAGDAAREVIVDGVTGRTVDPQNQGQLVEAILEIGGPKGVTMGQAGYDRFHSLFCYEQFLTRFAAALPGASPP